MSLIRLLQAITFGFLNTKTYNLLILLLLRGAKIQIFIWLLDAILKITPKMTYNLCVFFKFDDVILLHHQHRVAHLPHVYQDAHKFHHFLHDSSPFEAHLYGFGASEEWLLLVTEILPSLLLGVFPHSLSFSFLCLSLRNKVGHTRVENGNDKEIQHCDHHLHHIKNFTWNITLEMFMGTSTNNSKDVCNGYTISKEVFEGKSVFTYERN